MQVNTKKIRQTSKSLQGGGARRIACVNSVWWIAGKHWFALVSNGGWEISAICGGAL